MMTTTEPDRPQTVDDAARWLYGDQRRGWWDVEPNEVRHAAAVLLELRKRVTNEGE